MGTGWSSYDRVVGCRFSRWFDEFWLCSGPVEHSLHSSVHSLAQPFWLSRQVCFWPCAFKLDANQADAWAMQGEMATFHGRPEDGIEKAQRALRLNPHPPGWYYWELGYAQYAARQLEAAVETLRKESTYRIGSRRILAASLAQLGRMEEAHQEAELFMVSNPHFTIGYWAATQPFQDEAIRDHFVDGYRKAGLPE